MMQFAPFIFAGASVKWRWCTPWFVAAALLSVCVSVTSLAQDATGRDPAATKKTPTAKPTPAPPQPAATVKAVPPKAPSKPPAKIAVAKPAPKPAAPAAKQAKAVPVAPKRPAVAVRPAPKSAASAARTAGSSSVPPVRELVITPAATARPASARLTITAAPNALIELSGQTPVRADAQGNATFSGLSAGEYQLRCRANDYEPWTGMVSVKAPATTFTVPLRKAIVMGKMAIVVNQPNAEVFIDEQLSIRSAADKQIAVDGLPPGVHQVRAVKAGFQEWRKSFTVTAGETLRVEINLVPVSVAEMIRIPAGETTIGNNFGPEESKPAHLQTLNAYAIGQREVTNQQFQQFMQATKFKASLPTGWQEGNRFDARRAEMPVTGVSWETANAYCKWLSQQTGETYRLPTEAEWEKATRTAGLNFTPVATQWEWCADWYDPQAYQKLVRANPSAALANQRVARPRETRATQTAAAAVMPEESPQSRRVIRGGALTNMARQLNAFERNALEPQSSRDDLGFRVVLEGKAR